MTSRKYVATKNINAFHTGNVFLSILSFVYNILFPLPRKYQTSEFSIQMCDSSIMCFMDGFEHHSTGLRSGKDGGLG